MKEAAFRTGLKVVHEEDKRAKSTAGRKKSIERGKEV